MTVLIIVLISLLVILTLLCCGIYFFLFKPNFDRHDEPAVPIKEEGYLHEFRDVINSAIDWFEKVEAEDVYINSFDGYKLYGMFITSPAEKCKGTVIMCHGFHGIPPRDFAFLPDFYLSLGYNVLVINQRAHNKSGGKYLTYGIKERYDCRDWILYINERFGSSLPVFLHGLSMGCATVLMTSGFELPQNVKGIVADCGFTSPYDIIVSVLKGTMKLPAFPIMPLSLIMVKFIAGFGLKDYSTLDAMKTNKIPILFICGDKDDFVPTWMTQKNYDSCIAEKRLFWVKGAKHAESYFRDKEGFEAQVKGFLEDYT
ncbi:MAG: alpha/beta hydrolase [Treponemataceae bacterium]|nr:alpha/beta hydrolase [Treponemataceae bacterium]